MLDTINLLTLLAIMLILAAIPSTSVGLVVARSVTGGFTSGAAVAAGIVLGDLIFVLLAVLGMAALAETLGSLFIVIKYLAGLYLIWLGISLARNRTGTILPTSTKAHQSLIASFLAGLLVTLGDIKAIFFYASLFPVFINIHELDSMGLMLLVTVTILAVGSVKLAYAFGATKLSDLASNSNAQRPLKLGAGGFMMGAGIYLLAKS